MNKPGVTKKFKKLEVISPVGAKKNTNRIEKVNNVKKLKEELINCIEFYLSETIEDLTEWDCEHLAMGLLNSFNIDFK